MSQPSNQEQSEVWRLHAARWSLVGSPLRPSAEDSALMTRLAADTCAADARVLILGVTSEIVALPWLRHRAVLAVDHSHDMVRALWDGSSAAVRDGAHRCVLARWEHLPLPPDSIDLVLGDGSLTALPSPRNANQVLAELHRVMRPDAVCVLRVFSPSQRDSLAAIADDAWRGHIRSFDALKWRLAMLLAEPPDGVVAVDAVFRAFETLFPDRPALAQANGWDSQHVATLEHYRNSSTRYHFLSPEALRSLVEPWFIEEGWTHPTYELGHCCPTIRLRRRAETASAQRPTPSR